MNPFGTTVYDGLINETPLHYAMDVSEGDDTHLEGCAAVHVSIQMMAEPLALLYQKDAHHNSRLGYYGQPKVQHFKGVTVQTRATWQAVTPDLAKALANPNYCIGSIQ